MEASEQDGKAYPVLQSMYIHVPVKIVMLLEHSSNIDTLAGAHKILSSKFDCLHLCHCAIHSFFVPLHRA